MNEIQDVLSNLISLDCIVRLGVFLAVIVFEKTDLTRDLFMYNYGSVDFLLNFINSVSKENLTLIDFESQNDEKI